MTRLTSRDVEKIPTRLKALDSELAAKSGWTLLELAATTVGICSTELSKRLSEMTLAVIPITAGQGIIGGFSRSLQAIANHLGMDARVMKEPDVAGISEAAEDSRDLWLLSDDDCFIAWNTRTRNLVENSRATGEGYAVLLDQMGGGVRNKKCLVLGCGPVGTSAAKRLLRMEADVVLYDINPHQAGKSLRYLQTVSDKPPVIAPMDITWPGCRLILDATPVPDFLSAYPIASDQIVVSPGVPPGLTPIAIQKMEKRFYHDKLPLGVAVMIAAAVSGHHWGRIVFPDP